MWCDAEVTGVTVVSVAILPAWARVAESGCSDGAVADPSAIRPRERDYLLSNLRNSRIHCQPSRAPRAVTSCPSTTTGPPI